MISLPNTCVAAMPPSFSAMASVPRPVQSLPIRTGVRVAGVESAAMDIVPLLDQSDPCLLGFSCSEEDDAGRLMYFRFSFSATFSDASGSAMATTAPANETGNTWRWVGANRCADQVLMKCLRWVLRKPMCGSSAHEEPSMGLRKPMCGSSAHDQNARASCCACSLLWKHEGGATYDANAHALGPTGTQTVFPDSFPNHGQTLPRRVGPRHSAGRGNHSKH